MPDPTTDFAIFDAVELVTYVSMISPEVTNVRALRRPITQSRARNIERYIELDPTDVVFHMDGEPLASTILWAGDLITDAGSVSYAVQFVERQTLANSVVAVCRQQA